MGDFVLQAAIALPRTGQRVPDRKGLPRLQGRVEKPYETQNKVQPIYEASAKKTRPPRSPTPSADMGAEVRIIFQSVAGLHAAIPEHKGDWYFTGNFPTPGGNRVANGPSSTGRKAALTAPTEPRF